MQRYFNNLETIDRFTLSLDSHQGTVQCNHCFKSGHLVSHGFVYKQRSWYQTEVVGKRIFCSNRYGRSGCGKTTRLYIAEVLPNLQYTTTAVFVFLSTLLAGVTVKQAYQRATGQMATRNAWRWLNKSTRKMVDYRCFLRNRISTPSLQFQTRSKRLSIVLPTIARLFSILDHCPCAQYQLANQSRFI